MSTPGGCRRTITWQMSPERDGARPGSPRLRGDPVNLLVLEVWSAAERTLIRYRDSFEGVIIHQDQVPCSRATRGPAGFRGLGCGFSTLSEGRKTTPEMERSLGR